MRVFLLTLLPVLACTSTPPSPTSDGGNVSLADAGNADAGPDAGTPACDGGPCTTTTALVATFGNRSVTLDRAQLGVERTDAGLQLYVEAHVGGAPECPDESSPTPEQTLVLANIPAAPVGTVLTMDDGLRGSLLDFAGTLFDQLQPARATAITATVREISTEGLPFLVLGLDVTFDDGTLEGVLSATHCPSLDGP